MSRWLRTGAMALGLTAWCWSVAVAQDLPKSPAPPRIRIVVFQFTAAPNDSSHRALAASLSTSLVKALVADPTFLVMSHPRGARAGTGVGADAQYAILGAVSDPPTGLRVDLRVTDIAHVQLVGHDSASLASATGPSVDLMAANLAIRLRDRLTSMK